MSELKTEAGRNDPPDTLPDALLVLTTTATQQEAARVAQALLEAELAACVQMLAPMTSLYRWQGKLESASEVLLLIKTTRAAYAELEALLKQLHRYQTPEIIAVPVETVAADYLAWLQAAIKPGR
ncbi:MAG: divalent-cation tolerance protein CutA [Acidobacteria bacterium]|nr:divalent-cation tolerance protein CutA [Acidobacteriota bacterium]MBI3425988.1 divalent-cation tolerance protein CutA [Acidobacteriota bacterium]